MAYWFDENGDRYSTPDERTALAEQAVTFAEQQAAQERQLREELLAKLRDRGIDPNTLSRDVICNVPTALQPHFLVQIALVAFLL